MKPRSIAKCASHRVDAPDIFLRALLDAVREFFNVSTNRRAESGSLVTPVSCAMICWVLSARPSGLFCGQAESFIAAIGVEGLRTSQDCSHGLQRDPDDVDRQAAARSASMPAVWV